jgi:hypothetical protein
MELVVVGTIQVVIPVSTVGHVPLKMIGITNASRQPPLKLASQVQSQPVPHSLPSQDSANVVVLTMMGVITVLLGSHVLLKMNGITNVFQGPLLQPNRCHLRQILLKPLSPLLLVVMVLGSTGRAQSQVTKINFMKDFPV